jgi:hypothetical protein
MRFLQRAILYFIPTISILIFAYFVATAGGPHAAQWGASHGVDVAIVNNYRYVNSISLIAWIVVLAFVVAGRGALAQGTAIFGTAYALCDGSGDDCWCPGPLCAWGTAAHEPAFAEPQPSTIMKFLHEHP